MYYWGMAYASLPRRSLRTVEAVDTAWAVMGGVDSPGSCWVP